MTHRIQGIIAKLFYYLKGLCCKKNRTDIFFSKMKLKLVGPYAKERLENAICYFASEHRSKTGKWPSQTEIYKYLAFFEFELLEETGRVPLGLEYKAMEQGPVPYELYNLRTQEIKSDLFQFVFLKKEDDKTFYNVQAKSKPDMDYFSEYEQEKMTNLVEEHALDGPNASRMSSKSHERIRAWRIAKERKLNSPIFLADTFEGIENKPYKDLSVAEERFITSPSRKSFG